MRANHPVTDLLDAPSGKRISQLLFGESFKVEKTEGAESRAASHSISALASFVYAARYEIRSPAALALRGVD